MAYQARGRDPLLDHGLRETIEQRGKELIGMIALVLGVLALMVFLTYSPEDPSWLSSTDAPVHNMLGRTGAALAAPVVMILGLGSLSIAVMLLVWGLRFLLHMGEERAVGRVIFSPVAMAVASIYASTLVPGEVWTHSFGLGGLFGDTVLGLLLNVLPISVTTGLKLVSVALSAVMLVVMGFVLGFSMAEVKAGLRFLAVGLMMIFANVAALIGIGASGAASAARSARARRSEAEDAIVGRDLLHPEIPTPQYGASGHEYATHAIPASDPAHGAWPDPDAYQPPPAYDALQPDPPKRDPEKPGLLGRMPSLIKRADARAEPHVDTLPAPELVEPAPSAGMVAAPEDDRIRSKIADAIKSRARHGHPARPAAALAPKRAHRGPEPLVVQPQPSGLPPEPPLTASRTPPPLTLTLGGTTLSAPELGPQPTPVSDPEPMLLHPEAQVPPRPVAEPKQVVQHAPRKTVQPSARARQEAQPSLAFEETTADYELPPLGLLTNPANIQRHHLSDEALEQNARMLENVLDDYGVKGEIVSVRPGPVVTMYELEPAPGLKASRVIGLADDIARSMAALSARVSTVPGRSVIGIELPNENREKVVLREILSSRDFGDSKMSLPLALGKDIGGDPVVANLAKMPHLLIAGTTGSGKSVAINTMILSLLYKLTPEDCRLIMIDPKMLELSVYDGIPHLLSPVVTDPKKAVVALKWVVGEMEERYRKMSKMGVRNIEGYNGRVSDAQSKGETFSRTVQTGFDDETGEPVFETEEILPEKLPYIVVIVDEMADLMMVAGKEIEACIQRLAQMARASGIHLIMATQRPSVDVITGTIKANFPTRISFQVTSKVDSRTILGEMGAEQLLGMGDMLYMAGGAKITRCHGPFVSDEEVEEIVSYLKAFGPPDYIGGVVDGPDEDTESDIDLVLGLGGNTTGEDALYDQAVAIVIKDRKCSTSYIQRKLAIGYNKAARLVEQMEEEGLVSPANHVGKREILVPEQG